ncbi:MAG: 5-oxoprolinase subunit PxpA [Trueperaceae bacterium]
MAADAIDINADAGESFGPWPMGRDEQLYPLVSSVNLACGFHAGDPLTMRRSVRLAGQHRVAVGAHPGHADRVGFGRRELSLAAEEAYADVLYQVGALDAFVRSEGLTLHHVKPHGALYMQMLGDDELTRAVAAAVRAFQRSLPLVVLAGTAMQRAAEAEGAWVVREAFPDRGYLANGLLAPRSVAGSLIREPRLAGERALRMARGEPVETLDGGSIVLEPQTLCIHGDNPESVEIAKAVRETLESAGVSVRAY